MFKKILLFLLISSSFILIIGDVLAATREVRDTAILNGLIQTNTITTDNADGFTMLNNIINWFKNQLTTLLLVVSVGVFLFIGIRLGTARGNPEEFKKAFLHLFYAIIGIFTITIAWATVKLVSGITF